MSPYSFPPLSSRMLRLFMRNFLVWRKLFVTSIMTHFAEPMLFLLGFGYGVGALVGDINGAAYLQFLAGGMVCYGTMNSASFEGLYSAFTRMHVQRTWESILHTPMTLEDVLLGEWLWAAFKGMMAGVAMLIVVMAFGYARLPTLPALLLALTATAFCFSGIALAVNALATGYEFFSYYFTLFITPMMMLSGAFFPIETLPVVLQNIAQVLPLYHAIVIARDLLNGVYAISMLSSLAVIVAYALAGFYVAVVLTRRRLIH